MKTYSPHKCVSLFILFILLSNLLFLNSYAQQKPKLVIGIVVDQMSNDLLSRFADRFSETGFKRLLKTGFYFKNSYYEFVPTVTGPGHSCIYTGSVPYLNGIIGNEWYNKTKNEIIYCADDKSVNAVGVETVKEKYSPKNLLASTVTDELIKADNNSKVISISLKDRGAVFPGGHLGKSFWFDEYTGKFITSSYYTNELPDWINKFNERKLNDFYLSQTWNTLYPIGTYTASTPDNVPWETLFKGKTEPVFPYELSSLKEKTRTILTYTPFGNSILKVLTLTALESEKLGKGSSTDFLCVSFSSTDVAGHHFGPNSVEIEDMYLRLDKELSEIFDYIDQQIGFENTLLFLTSDHSVAPTPGYMQSLGIPAGNINTKQLKDSVEIFLNNKYGEDNWILVMENLQIYLNDKALKEKNISHEQIENDICDYLKNYEGVKEIYSSSRLMNGEYDSQNSRLIRNGFIKELSGDVTIVLDSNWITGDEWGTTHGSVYKYDRNVPLIWYGLNVKNGETDEYNSQCDIAPTVSDILNISPPDKSVGKSLRKIIVK